jgi:hypothetical protein
MFRRLTHLLAIGTLVTGGAMGTAAADPCCPGGYYTGSYYAGGYYTGGYDQFYVVNHGPVYSGPNIVVGSGYHHFEGVPAIYPYVGRSYWYRPYDGGPYADPIGHRLYHRYPTRYSYGPAGVYEPAYRTGPQIIRVDGRYHRPHHVRAPHPRAPRGVVLPPLDPREK